MSRSRLSMVAVALTAGAIGCAHCTTCDEFPTSFAAGAGAYAPTAAFAAGPMAGPYVEGPVMDYAAPPASQFVATPAPPVMTPVPSAQPGPFVPRSQPTSAAPAVSAPAIPSPAAPSDTPPAPPADAPVAPPAELDLSLPDLD